MSLAGPVGVASSGIFCLFALITTMTIIVTTTAIRIKMTPPTNDKKIMINKLVPPEVVVTISVGEELGNMDDIRGV